MPDARRAFPRIPQERGGRTRGGQPLDGWTTYTSLILPGTFNVFGTTDDTVTEIAAKVRGLEPGDAETEQLYEELNRHIVEDAWFAPLFRIQQELATVLGITAVPQAGAAWPTIYNYSLDR